MPHLCFKSVLLRAKEETLRLAKLDRLWHSDRRWLSQVRQPGVVYLMGMSRPGGESRGRCGVAGLSLTDGQSLHLMGGPGQLIHGL